jgi:TPR repeat protein
MHRRITSSRSLPVKTPRLAVAFAALPFLAAAQADPGAFERGNVAFEAHDYALARQQWEKAAQEGEPRALSRLADLMAQGLGMPPDAMAAAGLWLVAADAGVAQAHARLGQAAFEGTVLPRDLPTAAARLRCAIAAAQRSGDATDTPVAADAAARLAVVAGLLDDDQAREAARRAAECVASLPAAAAR